MRKKQQGRLITNLIIHWSASPAFTTVADIDRWHRERGYRMIGYHRVILHPTSVPNARVWGDLVKEGRDLDNDPYLEGHEVGAHTIGYNSNSVAICVVGSPAYKMHPLQREALRQTINILAKRFKIKRENIKTHRDFNRTACPGDEIHALVGDIRLSLI